jgi:hypothetical protein
MRATDTIADVVSYWLVIGGVYVLQAFLWYYSFKEKLFDDSAKAPPPIQKQFHGTIIDSFPGTSAAWAILGILEALIFLAVVASLLTGEFLPQRRKSILFCALALAMFTFAVMAFGETLTKQSANTANLYAYFGATAVIVVLLLLLPPYRPVSWLSSLWHGSKD